MKKKYYKVLETWIHPFGFGFARDKGIKDHNQFNEIEKIGYASGTCLFTSSKVLDKIGLLDPFHFFIMMI